MRVPAMTEAIRQPNGSKSEELDAAGDQPLSERRVNGRRLPGSAADRARGLDVRARIAGVVLLVEDELVRGRHADGSHGAGDEHDQSDGDRVDTSPASPITPAICREPVPARRRRPGRRGPTARASAAALIADGAVSAS